MAVIVPSGGSIVGAPPPTAVAASPRLGVVRCDAFGMITRASESTQVLLGRGLDTPVEGTPITNLLYPDDVEPALANWAAAKEQRGVALRWRCRMVRDDASSLWVEVTITNEIDADGGGEVRVDLDDISREVAATEALVAERELIELLTETLPVGVAKFDAHGQIQHAGLRSAGAALDHAGVISQRLQGPAEIAGTDVPIAASIGVAWTSSATAGELLGAADAAMYIAKQRRSMEPVLHDALDPGEATRRPGGPTGPSGTRPAW